MALIKCSECGQNVSDRASACPHCGNPLTPKVLCEECGYELSPNDNICPQCGCPIPAKVESTTNNMQSTDNRPPLVLSASEREYYYPKHIVFTSLIKAMSQEKTLKLGVYDARTGVIRANTKVSIFQGTGWGEVINVKITEVTQKTCRVKVQSISKGVTSPAGNHEQNFALIFRVLDFTLMNYGQSN